MSLENLKTQDPFAEAVAKADVEADDDTGKTNDELRANEKPKTKAPKAVTEAVSLAISQGEANEKPKAKKEGISIENLKTFDPFAEADDDTGETKKQAQDYIHIRIQQRNGRKTLTSLQGLPKKFDQKKILKVIKKKFACNGSIVDTKEMGQVIQLQGDQRKDLQEFLTHKEGLELDSKTIKLHGF